MRNKRIIAGITLATVTLSSIGYTFANEENNEVSMTQIENVATTGFHEGKMR